MFRKQILVDARFVIEPFEITFRNQLDEILVAGFILAQKNQVIRPPDDGIAIQAVRLGDVHFAADDGLHAGLRCGFVETHRTKKIAVIGDGNGGHAGLLRLFRKRLVTAGAVEQAESGMQVKMNELRHVYSHSIVAGGLDVMSYTTRLMPFTSLTIRVETEFKTS